MTLVGDFDRDRYTAGAPQWEPVARLAVRLNCGQGPAGGQTEPNLKSIATRLIDEAAGDVVVLRQALSVFVSAADRGPIATRAEDSLRLAIRLNNSHQLRPKLRKRLLSRA